MKIALILIFFYSLCEAIITIVPEVIGDEPGLNGRVEAGLETKRGNTDSDNYKLAIRIKYDTNDTYLIWGEISGSYAKANGEVNTQKSFTHIRYVNKTYLDYLDFEILAQSTTNEFTKVKRRLLGGGGVRFHRLDDSFGNLFFGLGAFYEYISYIDDIDPTESQTRINSYIAYTKELGEHSKIAYVGYYQPKASDFEDFVASNAIVLTVLIYEQIYINFKIYYDYDSKPALDVEKYDLSQVTSFIYKF
jgi:putative salt-induced outer membrane protein YdiY